MRRYSEWQMRKGTYLCILSRYIGTCLRGCVRREGMHRRFHQYMYICTMYICTMHSCTLIRLQSTQSTYVHVHMYIVPRTYYTQGGRGDPVAGSSLPCPALPFPFLNFPPRSPLRVLSSLCFVMWMSVNVNMCAYT